MITATPTRATLRRSARLGIAAAALLAAVTGASADDGGLGGFLASIFGGHPQQAATAPRPETDDLPRSASASTSSRRMRGRALTVRLHQARPRLVVAQTPTKPVKVSIYEDHTLRRGDAVMTADGVRIFAGSSSWPYTAGDFLSLKDARNVDRDASKVFAQLDKLPRS